MIIIVSNNAYDVIHVYVSVLAITMTYLFLKEARIIATSKALSKLYNPLRIGLIFSFISGLVFLGKKDILPESPDYIWLYSVIIILTILYIVSTLVNFFHIVESRNKIGIYAFLILALSATVLSPAISGAILIILLCFLVNYKMGLVLGVISFVYFISQFYYDLNFTLLTKSALLFSTGILFIILYLFIYKKLTADENV